MKHTESAMSISYVRDSGTGSIAGREGGGYFRVGGVMGNDSCPNCKGIEHLQVYWWDNGYRHIEWVCATCRLPVALFEWAQALKRSQKGGRK